MRYLLFLLLCTTMLLLSSCSPHTDVTVTWKDGTAKCSLLKGDRTFLFEVDKHANVVLECCLPPTEKPVIRLRGKAKGTFTYKAEHPSTIIVDGLNLSGRSGKTTFSIKNTQPTTLILRNENKLHDGSPACDTVSAKDCLRSKGHLTIMGDGELQLKASHTGSKGMKCKGNFRMLSGTLKVSTTGSYLREILVEREARFLQNMDVTKPDFPPFPGDGSPMPPPPPMPRPDDSLFDVFDPDNFPSDSSGWFIPSMVERDYKGTCKGVKIMGTAWIEGGELKVSTSSPGAEGFEAKKGINISGGKIRIEAYDDGISSNGQIIVTGGDIRVKSTHNDAIDSNYGKAGAYVQHGGRVEVISEAGPPEESLDTDWTPIVHDGGELIANPELQKEPNFGKRP